MRLSVIVAALVAALVGFGGTLALLLAAARALGADQGQASSWVAACCIAIAASSAYLSLTSRKPIITAWSTPGAALVAGFGAGVGMEKAVGAFLFAAALMLACAAIRPLGNVMARIPVSVAAAMLAGVLMRFAMAVAESATGAPVLVLPLVALFFLVRLASPSAAVLSVLVAGIAGVFALGLNAPLTGELAFSHLAPMLPAFDGAVLLSLGLPLFIVTMASQNLPGFAVLRAAGYTPPTRAILAVTGGVSAVAAVFGAHATNLAAITAALCTGPDAHPDPAKRYLCGPVYALFYLLLAALGASLVAVFAAVPPALIATVAGLALLSPLVGALTAALADEGGRLAAVATFATTVSGISALGLGAPVWGLAVGLVVLALDAIVGKKRQKSVHLPR